MKILQVYQGRDEFLTLKSSGKSIFRTFENYMKRKFPLEYMGNYLKNLETLKIFEVDQLLGLTLETGEYSIENNTIYFSDVDSFGHELVHLASSDLTKKRIGFSSVDWEIEQALIEGMTEFISLDFMGYEMDETYAFEIFCAAMICENKKVFRPFFLPNYEEFIELFPNRKNIYSLMYSLTFYSNMINYEKDALENQEELISAVRNCIDMLLDIELDYEKNHKNLLRYRDKFMSYLENPNISYFLDEIDYQYLDYASTESYKKLVKRGD